MRRFCRGMALTALALLLATAAGAATTGNLRGQVTDGQGSGLPGVTVTLSSSEVLGGPWIRMTDAAGFYQFPQLQPGGYQVTFTLDAFATQQADVKVQLDRTAEVNAELSPSTVSEEIVVTAEAPVIDPEQVGTGQVYNAQYLNEAVVGSANRSYQSVLTQTAGVTGGSNPNVLGSTLGENAYYVDGITTTDPVTATFGTNFNFDAIQEIALHTGGFEAEYGQATGGVVNLITKSGGNQLSGTVDARYRDNSLYESGDHFDPDAQETKFLNPSATLGGPILRDKLWFFTAYEYTDSRATPAGSPTTRKFVGNYYLGKLTYQLNDSWRLIGKYTGDPAEINNQNAGPFVMPEATYFQEQGGDIFQAAVDGVLSPSLFWDFKAGINRQELNSFPDDRDFTSIGHYDTGTGESYGNYTNRQYSNRDRDEYKTSLTWFLDGVGGSHEIKSGLEVNDLSFGSENYTTAGASYTDLNGGPYLFFISPNPGPSDFDGEIDTAYVQDAWRINPRLTAKLGVRYDQVSFNNDAGDKVADMDKVQPRLGLAWDVKGDATTVVRASAGRFMHPNALTLPSFARVNSAPSFRYVSCSRYYRSIGGLDDPSQCDLFSGQYSAGGYTVDTWLMDPDGVDPYGYFLYDVQASAPSRIADGLKPMYADEVVVGVEHAFGPRTSLEVSYVDKETKDIFEDTCNGNLPAASPDAACDYYVMANLPGLKRDYQGVITRFETRPTDRLHFIASYTYSDSKTSVGYTQNSFTDFDFYPFDFVNRYGLSEAHHHVKVNGYVQLPWQLTAGVNAFWTSAYPWTPLTNQYNGEGHPYGGNYVYAEPRGSRKGWENYQLDVELRKGFTFGDTRAQLIGTVLNVLSSEQPTNQCSLVQGCSGGLQLGDPTAWQTPRRYEAGVRLEF